MRTPVLVAAVAALTAAVSGCKPASVRSADTPPLSASATPTTAPTTSAPATTTPTEVPATLTPTPQALPDCNLFAVAPTPRPAAPLVSVTLEASKTILKRGEPVTLTLRARNVSGQRIQSTKSGTRAGWVWVLADGRWIWRTSYTLRNIGPDNFEPGQEKTESSEWDQSLCNPPDDPGGPYEGPPPPGRYTAAGYWGYDPPGDDPRGGAWWSNTVELEIR